MEPYASVIIPTKNGMPLFRQCLDGVLSQKVPWPFEVVVVDSGSRDGTWELAQAKATTALRIRPEEFNHGATRNLAAGRARGAFLVFLVQDAVPADDRWLAALVAAVEPEGIAGAFSRQAVRPDSNPITGYLCLDSLPSGQRGEVKRLPPGRRLDELSPVQRYDLSRFQNPSSCIRRSVFEAYPFARLPYGEDLEWGKRVVEAGYGIAYEPSSCVYHSHDRSPLYALKRSYADHSQAAALFDYVMVPSIARALRTAASYTLSAWRYALRSDLSLGQKVKFDARVPAYIAALTAGQYLGPKIRPSSTRVGVAARIDRFLRKGV